MKLYDPAPPTAEEVRARFDELCDLAARLAHGDEERAATNLLYLDRLSHYASGGNVMAQWYLDTLARVAPTLDATPEARTARIASVRARGFGCPHGGKVT